MRSALFFLVSSSLIAFVFKFEAEAAPAGPLIKHLSSLVKWTRSSSKSPHQSDGNVLQFEDGYLVQTVFEGNELGVEPYSIRVSQDAELFAVDAVNSNIVRITPPLSQYSRARLVAGSFQGRTGHVDGKPSDARFNHPKGVTMDDKGNIYVADVSNLAIRKIGEAGVTTIAGGKSNVAGYRDGPSEDAKFSTDFDVIYVRPTCSLLVVDRGNAALRQISLSKEDCDYENSSLLPTDLLMVAGAIIVGYLSCVLQQGLGSCLLSKMKRFSPPRHDSQLVPTVKDEPQPGWPSFGQLVWDLAKVVLEALHGILVLIMPSHFLFNRSKRGLTPLKDSLVMPEDEAEPTTVLKQSTPTTPLSETRQAEVKPPRVRQATLKEQSLSSKHRSSRRHEYGEFYGSSEGGQHGEVRPKSQKERSKHRHKEKSSGDGGLGTSKPAETKATSYDNAMYDAYMRNKYGEW